MLTRLLAVDRVGPRTGPNGTVIKTPAEKYAGKGRGNWACWDHDEKDILLAAAERWSKQLPRGRPLLALLERGRRLVPAAAAARARARLDAGRRGRRQHGRARPPSCRARSSSTSSPACRCRTSGRTSRWSWSSAGSIGWRSGTPTCSCRDRCLRGLRPPVRAAPRPGDGGRLLAPQSAPTANVEQQRPLVRGDRLHHPRGQPVASGSAAAAGGDISRTTRIAQSSPTCTATVGTTAAASATGTRLTAGRPAGCNSTPAITSRTITAPTCGRPAGSLGAVELAQVRGRAWASPICSIDGVRQVVGCIGFRTEPPNYLITQSPDLRLTCRGGRLRMPPVLT